MDANSASLEDLIARLFIARTDVKAYQGRLEKYRGQYFTHIKGDRDNPTYTPWTRQDIRDHLSGEVTYGHYLLNKENECKLFAFDIDISQEAFLPTLPLPTEPELNGIDTVKDWEKSFQVLDGRETWQDRRHPARAYIKQAMRSLAHVLEQEIISSLQIPTAVTYTGNKGLHVYGFTGLMPAKEVREGAMLVVEALPIKPLRGKMIFQWDSTLVHEKVGKQLFKDHEMFTIEVFPKQDQIGSDGFGNLMRLPLGVNTKSPKDPTFFVDTDLASKPLGDLSPTDPLVKLRKIAGGIS